MTLEGNSEETGEEIAEEIAEEIVEEIEDEPAEIENDIDVVVVEAPEIPEPEPFAIVNVGDLHIEGPPKLVEKITAQYLDDHIDHNPHDVIEEPAEVVNEAGETIGEVITPDIVEDQIAESVQDETVDAPPGPSDWLFKPLGGRS